MLHLLLVTLLVPQLVLSASLVPCPDFCQCDYIEQSLEVTCENFDFLNKLVTKQYSSITTLRINGSAVEKVNPKLKYLKNLETLDVSHNNVFLSHLPALAKLRTLTVKDNSLKDIKFGELPGNVENLDLSDNYLSKIPRDWRSLKHLKTINLSKNPINCDCQNVLEYQEMRNKVGVVGLVVCSGPKEFRGKSIESVVCSPLDMMLGDDEGSGEAEDETYRGLGVDIIDEDNEVKVPGEEMSIVTEDIVGGDEGSGDEQEGSGFGLVEMPRIDETGEEPENETEGGSGLIPVMPNVELPKACVENCTENSGLEEEANASPLPGIKEQFDILNEDLFAVNREEKTTTEQPITTVTEEIQKPIILKESEAIPEKKDNEKDDKENYTLTENTKLGRASVGGEGSYDNTVYVIMGVIFLALVCIVIFFIKKKNRSSNNRRKQIPEENFGEELKPLEKKPLTEKIPLNPDRTPLMNGNGKVVDDIPKEDDDLEFKEVDIRPKDNSDLLTPKRERVTIKETEIPDSIPKTPLLVHREVSSDGQIVLTPIDNP